VLDFLHMMGFTKITIHLQIILGGGGEKPEVKGKRGGVRHQPVRGEEKRRKRSNRSHMSLRAGPGRDFGGSQKKRENQRLQGVWSSPF